MNRDVYVHSTSHVSSDASIGKGTKIWQYCTVMAGARIGEDCMLSQNVYVEGRTRIGNRVKIKNNVSVFECVEMEDDVFVGPSAVFTNVLTPRSHWPRKSQFKRTVIQKGATIGANAAVVCGVVVGRYAMIGAGAVVTRDVADFALAYGNPARRCGWVCYCGVTLGDWSAKKDTVCPECLSRYVLENGTCREVSLNPRPEHGD